MASCWSFIVKPLTHAALTLDTHWLGSFCHPLLFLCPLVSVRKEFYELLTIEKLLKLQFICLKFCSFSGLLPTKKLVFFRNIYVIMIAVGLHSLYRLIYRVPINSHNPLLTFEQININKRATDHVYMTNEGDLGASENFRVCPKFGVWGGYFKIFSTNLYRMV